MIQLIHCTIDNGTIFHFEYLLDGENREMDVSGIFKSYILEHHKHNGINEVNYEDFIMKADVKYKLEDKYLVQFLQWYHKI